MRTMTRLVQRSRAFTALIAFLAVFTLATACATTSVGKAIQAADVQKMLVEEATVELIKLHIQGAITDDVYLKAKDIYGKWYVGQKALAETLAQWRLIASAENNQKLERALQAVGALSDTYLAFAGQFLDLERLKQRIIGQ